MKPSGLNQLCAHPVAISWVVGACGLNATVAVFLFAETPPRFIFSDVQATLELLMGFFLLTPLGYFFGMFTCWPMARRLCSRYNGAPLISGDQVIILSGQHTGVRTMVDKTMIGQGGWPLAELNLGKSHQEVFSDIFEEYQVLRLNARTQLA